MVSTLAGLTVISTVGRTSDDWRAILEQIDTFSGSPLARAMFEEMESFTRSHRDALLDPSATDATLRVSQGASLVHKHFTMVLEHIRRQASQALAGPRKDRQ